MLVAVPRRKACRNRDRPSTATIPSLMSIPARQTAKCRQEHRAYRKTRIGTLKGSRKRTRPAIRFIRAELPAGGTVTGRDAWALARLSDAGPRGVTTAELPAGLRWAHYIWKLRRAGFDITLETEAHTGAFGGTHSRYRLASPVRFIEVQHDGNGDAA